MQASVEKEDAAGLYRQSLEAFSEFSDEDSIISDSIYDVLRVILDKENGSDTVNWLDIGSGNAKKISLTIAEISSILENAKKYIDLTLLERDPHWELVNFPAISNLTTTRHTYDWPNSTPEGSFSFVTLLHSAYQFAGTAGAPNAEYFETLAKVMAPDGILLVAHEAETSAIFRAKELIYPDIGGTLIRDSGIMHALRHAKFDIVFTTKAKEFLRVPEGRLGPDSPAFPWFLFDSATSHSSNVDDSSAKKVAEFLNARMNKRGALRIDDCVILAKPRNNV